MLKLQICMEITFADEGGIFKAKTRQHHPPVGRTFLVEQKTIEYSCFLLTNTLFDVRFLLLLF